MTFTKLTDSELLALVDNRIDILTNDHPRCGYGISWESDVPKPSRDKYQTLLETIELLEILRAGWKRALNLDA